MIQEYFGTDMQLTDGDLVLSSSGDVQAIAGSDNVVQAIQNVIFTEKGSLFYDMDYGISLSSLMGEKNILITRTLLRNSIITALYKDSRIKTVDSVSVTQNKNNAQQVDVSINATLINDEQIVGNLIYPNVKPTADTNSISDEEQKSVSEWIIYTQYNIFDIKGVYLKSDVNKAGTNYYTGGSVSKNKIILGTKLPGTYTDVIIDYVTLSSLYTSKKITQIVDEKVLCIDGKSLKLKYTIYNLTNIYDESDTQKVLNYAVNATYVSNNVVFNTPASAGINYYVTYYTDEI